MCFFKHLNLTFSVGLPEKINYLVPASQQIRFQPLRVIERFCVESSNLSTVIVGNSSNDLELFIYRTFRTSISSFSTLHKVINAFPFFPRNSGRGGLTSGIVQGLESVESGPFFTLNEFYSRLLSSGVWLSQLLDIHCL